MEIMEQNRISYNMHAEVYRQSKARDEEKKIEEGNVNVKGVGLRRGTLDRLLAMYFIEHQDKLNINEQTMINSDTFFKQNKKQVNEIINKVFFDFEISFEELDKILYEICGAIYNKNRHFPMDISNIIIFGPGGLAFDNLQVYINMKQSEEHQNMSPSMFYSILDELDEKHNVKANLLYNSVFISDDELVQIQEQNTTEKKMILANKK